jgi:hypothetical protein
MSEVARRRRRKQLEGCGVALVFLGGFAAAIALAIGAFTAEAPVNGICSIALGLGAIAINRALAEGGAVGLTLAFFGGGMGAPPTAPDPRRDHPHWYSPGRLIIVAVGLFLVVSGIVKIAGG